MKLKINRWDRDIEFGEKWEIKLKQLLQESFRLVKLNRIDFENNKELQLDGIDIIFNTETGNIQIKTRRDEYNDIAFEERTSMDHPDNMCSGKLGWVYSYKEKNIIMAYIFSHSLRGYFLILDNDFYKWYENNKDNYSIKPAYSLGNGNSWWTINRIIPIKEIPEQFIKKFNVRNYLDLTNQTKLDINGLKPLHLE